MKRNTSLLLAFLRFRCPLALAEELGFPGVWSENDGYGTLVILADGTARMDYYDGTVTECHWALTDEGAKFTDGMWLKRDPDPKSIFSLSEVDDSLFEGAVEF